VFNPSTIRINSEPQKITDKISLGALERLILSLASERLPSSSGHSCRAVSSEELAAARVENNTPPRGAGVLRMNGVGGQDEKGAGSGMNSAEIVKLQLLNRCFKADE